MADLRKVHSKLLLADANPESLDYAGDLAKGDYDKVLSLPESQALFASITERSWRAADLQARVSTEEDYSKLIAIAIALLHSYIQANVTGPALTFDPFKVILPNAEKDQFLLPELEKDGETPFSLMSYPHLLVFALILLKELSGKEGPLQPFAKWWYARALVIHQSILSGESASIYEEIFSYLSLATVNAIVGSDVNSEESKQLFLRYKLEAARAKILYGYEHKADPDLETAQKLSGFEWVLTGLRGKRTKFQQTSTSQLIVIAKSKEDKTVDTPEEVDEAVPSAMQLNSDLLLEKTDFSEDGESQIPEELRGVDPNNQPALQDIDVANLLLREAKIRQSTPLKNVLVEEELTAMVNRIINSPPSTVNWCLFSRALWDRSVLEAYSVKHAERGTLQIQSLVEELGQANVSRYLPQSDVEQKHGNVSRRMAFIHQLLPLPKWQMDVKLAERYMEFGALKSALEVYERLEMPNEISLCYAAVGDETTAKKVINEHLEKHPKDSRAWSILGDITNDPQYWEKAWEIGRYAPAKRSLGNYYFSPPKGVERNLDLVIKHLNDSLHVNPLHAHAWFMYGVAGLQTGQWELAAEAFTRCVAIDEDDPKAWSNLSTALLKLNKKKEAFNALKQAVKGSQDTRDWRIWTNFITVAADLNEWNDVLRGVNIIIDIRGKKDGEAAIDIDMVERLVQLVVGTEYKVDEEGNANLDHFQKSVMKLVTVTIPALITSDCRLWKLVARVYVWQKKPWAALESYEKGYRIIIQHVEVDEKTWNEAVDFCGDLIDAYINFGPQEGRIEGSVVCPDWKFKARTTVRSLMGKGKTLWEGTNGWEKLQQIKEEVAQA
ncbi:essential for maintenance of the cell wall protein 1 [Trichomonascus vanleenenianus]|uniref:tetratricopeptide repeat-containing protein EMW1 n=1 Tax=Trichomonascus vanleenenianus TaxID=2268995 RepID=UPI003ECB7D9F